MFRLSPHRLSIFRQCRRRYWYRYVDRRHAELHKQWPFLIFGQTMHATLKQFLGPANHERGYAQARAILVDRWAETRAGYTSRDEEAMYWRRGLAQLRWLCNCEEAQARPSMLEATYSTYLTSDFRLDGKIDRVDVDGTGGCHVVDYKTGKSSRGADALQLLIYALILSGSLHFDVRSASFLFLNGEGRRPVQPGEADLRWAREELFATRADIEAEREFKSSPSFLCRWCDFLDLCPAGREAVTGVAGDEPDWAEEPES